MAVSTPDGPLRVVVVGVGPAGLLLAHYLLTHGNGRYSVQMFERAEDPREIMKNGSNSYRYSMGLCRRGMQSLDGVPGLLQKVKDVSVESDVTAVLLGGNQPRVIKADSKDWKPALIDRTAMCASMVGELEAKHEGSGLLSLHFGHACQSVDLADRRAFFGKVAAPGTAQSQGASMLAEGAKEARTMAGFGAAVDESSTYPVEYDLLVGADGVRSRVRLAMMQQGRFFNMSIRDIFNEWACTHIPCPPGHPLRTLHIIPKAPGMKDVQGIGLPSPDGTMCFLWGWPPSSPPTEWLSISSPAEAKAWMDARLPYMHFPEDAAWELVQQPKKHSMQVKCDRYHDLEGSAVLIGDAAHATSPAIGQGCNSSLVDAAVLGRLLIGVDVNETNRIPQQAPLPAALSVSKLRSRLPAVLERFSALQVKEGHALVDMSWAGSALNRTLQLFLVIQTILYTALWKWLPWLLTPPQNYLCTATTMPYHQIRKIYASGVDYVGRSNDAIRNKWMEEHATDVVSTPLD